MCQVKQLNYFKTLFFMAWALQAFIPHVHAFDTAGNGNFSITLGISEDSAGWCLIQRWSYCIEQHDP